ncbi:MAG: DinB family protein [Acidobacteria bacterium]|nr:DinB family protein [Acidobacteriota bacterium]
MNRQERLSSVMERVQQARASLLGKAEDLKQPQLDFKPSRSAWSAGEVVHHVGLAEQVFQGYLRELLRPELQERGAIRRLSLQELPFGASLVPDFLLRSPFVLLPVSIMVNFIPAPVQSLLFEVPIIKMQTGDRMQPTHGLTRAALLDFVREVRRTTLGILAPAQRWNLSRFRITHPLIGNKDVYGILELVASHDQRHQRQIERVRENPGFPR